MEGREIHIAINTIARSNQSFKEISVEITVSNILRIHCHNKVILAFPFNLCARLPSVELFRNIEKYRSICLPKLGSKMFAQPGHVDSPSILMAKFEYRNKSFAIFVLTKLMYDKVGIKNFDKKL